MFYFALLVHIWLAASQVVATADASPHWAPESECISVVVVVVVVCSGAPHMEN